MITLDYDVVIAGGRVFDGTGVPVRELDLGSRVAWPGPNPTMLASMRTASVSGGLLLMYRPRSIESGGADIGVTSATGGSRMR